MQDLKYLLIMLFALSSCRKFVTVDPPSTQLVNASVFSNDATANAAMTGVYAQMMSASGSFFRGGSNGLSLLAGLSADELKNNSSNPLQSQFYRNTILPSSNTLQTAIWAEPYNYIYTANSILEGLNKSNNISAATLSRLRGEALFIRALCHFYLANLYGNIPLVLSTDYRANAALLRSDTAALFTQLVKDLQEAIVLLPADDAANAGLKIRPNQWAARALLSRVYLYRKDWTEAAATATAIINNAEYILETDLNNVFLANSSEAIWQLMPVIPGYNTNDGNIFILLSAPTVATLSNSLLNAFEPGDLRRSAWVDSYTSGANTWFFPAKYKIKTGNDLKEYAMVFRLAEQFLIRAEAYAAQSKLVNAVADMDAIRHRAGLTGYSGPLDKDSIIDAVIRERRVELFTEYGHRWFDLKRTNSINTVMTMAALEKGSTWKPEASLFPLPQYELSNNPKLVQNPGY